MGRDPQLCCEENRETDSKSASNTPISLAVLMRNHPLKRQRKRVTDPARKVGCNATIRIFQLASEFREEKRRNRRTYRNRTRVRVSWPHVFLPIDPSRSIAQIWNLHLRSMQGGICGGITTQFVAHYGHVVI